MEERRERKMRGSLYYSANPRQSVSLEVHRYIYSEGRFRVESFVLVVVVVGKYEG